MLDYGNLSFISAQNPYVALIRSGQARPEPRLRADVELYVYGWSRRVLYTSGAEAPAADRTGVPRRVCVARAVLGDDRQRSRRASTST